MSISSSTHPAEAERKSRGHEASATVAIARKTVGNNATDNKTQLTRQDAVRGGLLHSSSVHGQVLPLQAPVRVVVELAGVDDLLCKHEGLRYKSRAPLQ